MGANYAHFVQFQSNKDVGKVCEIMKKNEK